MRPTRALLLLLLAALARAENSSDLCGSPQLCECNQSQHPNWNAVVCTLDPQQELFVEDGYLPLNTITFTVFGGKSATFGTNSLSRLKGLQVLKFHETNRVVLRKHASVEQNVNSLTVQSTNCTLFQFESATFVNLRGPLSVTVRNCTFATFGKKAFSWLLALDLRDIRQLHVVSETFTLDQTAINIGIHGPGMTIELLNVGFDLIPAKGFTASAGLIRMEDVEVNTVSADAFGANTYNIVLAINTKFNKIHPSAFAPNSLIHALTFYNCTLHNFSNNAIQSAIGRLNFASNRFHRIGTGAINGTVGSVTLQDNRFEVFDEKGFIFSSSSKYFIDRNSFDYLPPFAMIAPGSTPIEFSFINNDIETMVEESLPIIGRAFDVLSDKVLYGNNYYGMKCHCDFSNFLRKATMSKFETQLDTGSFCMLDYTFARCFNIYERNMPVSQFMERVCTSEEKDIQCDAYTTKKDGKTVEIKNPRFPHKHDDKGLSERDEKVIGIVIVTALGCVIIVLLFSLFRWMRRRGHCGSIKNILFSCNSSCGSLCERACGLNNGIDDARSISQLSVQEYSERHRLNEPRIHDMVQEIALPNIYTVDLGRVDEKTTQTMPEELTKELLENLKEKLDDPVDYAEAREMIEHLYELIKVEEDSAANGIVANVEENIYELPYQHTMPRLGRNQKPMISVGTKTPSLDKLLPLSSYNRQTALAHEYFQPKDFAVHLYAEIANCTSNRARLGAIPDVVLEQTAPRGPYLRAVRDKMDAGPSARPNIAVITNPQNMSTIKSNKSTTSNSSAIMLNRPLPEKPSEAQDPGEGTSRG